MLGGFAISRIPSPFVRALPWPTCKRALTRNMLLGTRSSGQYAASAARAGLHIDALLDRHWLLERPDTKVNLFDMNDLYIHGALHSGNSVNSHSTEGPG